MTCQARRNGGDMHCLKCRLSWSRDEDESPCPLEAPVIRAPSVQPDIHAFVSGLPDSHHMKGR